VDNVQNKSAVLLISTIANNQRDLFWYIDENIRKCHKTGKITNKSFRKTKTSLFSEYSMIKSTQKLKCQLISNQDADVISLEDGAKPTGEAHNL
jgi:hypothetical protein